MSDAPKTVILAYSGGLDTTVILTWLQETYGCEVITYSADLGQGTEVDTIRERALAAGAKEVVIENLQERFAEEFVFPAFRANAIYENQYLLGTSLGRPLIAERLVAVARQFGADAIVHGATGKGNDQVRFEFGIYALAPDLKVIAPWRTWEFKSRSDLIAYARQHGLQLEVTGEKPYSMDRNLLHLSIEGGALEDPAVEAPPETYVLTNPPWEAPDQPEDVEIEFEKGDPFAVNGVQLSPAEILTLLNALGGKHGIGRIDIVENRYLGMKSRGIYETPGGTLIRTAHMAVESITMDRELLHQRNLMLPGYSKMIYEGYWFAPEREAMQAFIDTSQKSVTGKATLRLYKGAAYLISRSAEKSLYKPEYSTFEEDEVYNQADAEGFIKLNSLRLTLWNQMKGGKDAEGQAVSALGRAVQQQAG